MSGGIRAGDQVRNRWPRDRGNVPGDAGLGFSAADELQWLVIPQLGETKLCNPKDTLEVRWATLLNSMMTKPNC
jgi:hypothetical protein